MGPGVGWRESRWLSALEFVLGATVVVLHNVQRMLPNEVPILFVAGWISLRLRNGGWSAVGLRRPESWVRTLLLAVVAAVVRVGLGELVIFPAAARIWPHTHASAVLTQVDRGPWHLLASLGLIWTFAAFGEEMGYRGYLLSRAAEAGGKKPVAYAAALIAVSALFGLGHFYKGMAGVLDSAFAGLVLGGTYLLAKRNLWAPILAHGLIDTFAVVAIAAGLGD